MTSDIQVFESPDFGRIRTLDVDGVPYWVAADVVKALGYSHTNNAVKRHTHGALKRCIVDSRGRMQNMCVIPEADVYRLIVHSKLPEAQKFERWVFEEILPQIRRTGAYLPVPASPADGVTDTNVGCILPETQKLGLYFFAYLLSIFELYIFCLLILRMGLTFVSP